MSSGWGHAKLIDRWLGHVWSRLTELKKVGVMALMVVSEFVRERIAPLQRHSRPMGLHQLQRTHEALGALASL